jgi:hypothetical protein
MYRDEKIETEEERRGKGRGREGERERGEPVGPKFVTVYSYANVP